MKNVIIRSISGIVYVGLLVGCVLAGGAWFLTILSVFAVLGIHEYIVMSTVGKYPRISGLADMACGVMMVITFWFFGAGEIATSKACALSLLIIWIARLIGQLYWRGEGRSVDRTGNSSAALLYVALPLSLGALLYNMLPTSQLFLALLIFIWVNDTGAFCFGCLFGRHKLFERISPKKTWEGFFGGLLFCVGAALVMHYCFGRYYPGISAWGMCRTAILVAVFATFGDLIESQIKRSVGVKDSSHLIPGHGGILDRIDSILLVLPMAVVYFSVI